MALVKKSTGRKRQSRMRRLREIGRKKREEAKTLVTREQAAILLKAWSRQGIVGEQE